METKISLDQAIKRLAEITREMENEDHNLEQQMALYEEGMKLLHIAKETLAQVELKVQRDQQYQ